MRDGKTDIVEEGAIGDDLAEGPSVNMLATSVNLQWSRWSGRRLKW